MNEKRVRANKKNEEIENLKLTIKNLKLKVEKLENNKLFLRREKGARETSLIILKNLELAKTILNNINQFRKTSNLTK